MLICEGEDLYNLLQKHQPTMFVKQKDDTPKLWAELVPAHLSRLEQLLGDNEAFTSTNFSAGELYLWGMLYQMELVQSEVLKSTPKLGEWYASLKKDQRVQKVINGESGMGQMQQYFTSINP